MRKYLLLLCLACFSTLTLAVFADACSPFYSSAEFSNQQNITMNGPTHCTSGNSSVSVINGPVSAANTHFTNPVVINGPIHTDHVIFDQAVVINGPADLINSHFSKSLNIRGPIHASASDFLGDVSIWSDTAKFDHCTLATFSMHDASAVNLNANPMTVDFYNQSLVTGDVSFLTASLQNPAPDTLGVAYLDQSSKIQGKINSGKMILNSPAF